MANGAYRVVQRAAGLLFPVRHAPFWLRAIESPLTIHSPRLSMTDSHHSPEEILAHPRFAIARARFVDAILALYEGDPFLTRLMGEAARGVIFLVILCLDAGYEADDQATWLTLKRLKQQMAQYGLSSPRHIESTVALLVHNGFVESI